MGWSAGLQEANIFVCVMVIAASRLLTSGIYSFRRSPSIKMVKFLSWKEDGHLNRTPFAPADWLMLGPRDPLVVQCMDEQLFMRDILGRLDECLN